jgi:hypothetical protein
LLGGLLIRRLDGAEDFPTVSDQHRLPPTQLGFLWSGHAAAIAVSCSSLPGLSGLGERGVGVSSKADPPGRGAERVAWIGAG